MKGTDAAALTDRLARALSWADRSQDQRNNYTAHARRLLEELEVEYEQMNVIGWMFVTTDEKEGSEL